MRLVVGLAPAPPPGARLVGGGALQGCPAGLLQRLGAGAQGGVVVHAEEEVDPLGPAVEVRGQREVGVPAQAHPLGVRLHQLDRLVDPFGRTLVAGRVAGTVDQVQHFLGVGQRHDQRRVPPDALVGDVHPRLVFPAGGRDGAVRVEVGDRAEQISAPARPQLRAHRVDRLHQRHHVILGEPAAEVPRGGRVGDQIRAQRVHVGGVMPQPLDVLQPGAAAGHVVGEVQHVIGLLIGQVHLQQGQTVVDLLDQAQLGHQPMHRGDPPEAGGIDVPADLVAHRARVQHRCAPRAPLPRAAMTSHHLAPPPRDVSPALPMRYLLHQKGLSCQDCVEVANPGRVRPFPLSGPADTLTQGLVAHRRRALSSQLVSYSGCSFHFLRAVLLT
jgi:hypothetical protein